MLEMTGCEDVIATKRGTGTGLRDNELALVFSVPFLCTISKVYSCIAKAQCWRRPSIFWVESHCSEAWSVISVKERPNR